MAYKVSVSIDGYAFYETFAAQLSAEKFISTVLTEGYRRNSPPTIFYYPTHRISLISMSETYGD